jgi:chemotaxis protein methyltransferase CheR
VRFLQWALPRLHMRWPGFRKVRKQVCRRIGRRTRELGLADLEGYRSWLEQHPVEWSHLDTLCRITISRFYRDRAVFDILAEQVLPILLDAARQRSDEILRVWSAGCGSGEEPYTLALIWHCALQKHFPGMDIDIVATEVDAQMLGRARAGRYAFASLKELPAHWRDRAFRRDDAWFCLEAEYRRGVRFVEQDLREEGPEGCFDLVLCRNLAFTYFDEERQREVVRRIVEAMHRGAALVIGAHERLPDNPELSPWFEKLAIYRRDPVAATTVNPGSTVNGF